MDQNLVEIWLRRDPARWAAGLVAGLFAGAVAMAFAMGVSVLGGGELWMPVKYPALPLLGASAMEIGFITKNILVGILVHGALTAFLGLLFAQFTGTNSFVALLGVGFTWGCFSWIFLNNLFFQSFRDVFVFAMSPGIAFAVCLVFGLSLTSVAFFDRLFRTRGRA